MATKVYSTPGVYIEEKSGFSSSAVQVATAVPAFVGYTQRALRGKKTLTNIPTRISSYAEFVEVFGNPPTTTFEVQPNEEKDFEVIINKDSRFLLPSSIRLFYSNGGGDCYIVSVGNFSSGITLGALANAEDFGGLHALLKEQEPTMVVIPDAVMLDVDECHTLQQAMLLHCGAEMGSRVALFDVHDGYKDRKEGDYDVVNKFREGIGMNFLQYGAAYYPWINTTAVQATELDYTHVTNVDVLSELLNKEVEDQLSADFIKQKRGDEIKAVIVQLSDPASDITLVSNTLKAVSPMFKEILSEMQISLNLMPPSGAMAGVYSMVDAAFGVWRAPANVSVSAVTSPTINLTNDNQEDLNMPLNGKAVNAIRSFVGKGVLVWGARTLDGNSQDWRYISVRRTVIMLEQSIKTAAEAFVFAPNTASTWVSIKAMIDNFLRTQWAAGALAGASPGDAYEVSIGLGSTMTANDILDGMMKISVKVAVSRPAEFIIITFQQQQQKS